MAWRKRISIEYFPPQTPAGMEKMLAASDALACLEPTYMSVTYGAGGSTQTKTLAAVDALKQRGFDVAPHLSCIGATAESISDMLNRYREAGIHRIVALRGDLPSGTIDAGDFRYAIDLVRFIRRTHGHWFTIKVAAYPEVHPHASSPDSDIQHFCNKIYAGANEAITQYFYNADAYCFFVQACRKHGIEVPIIPGIMPILSGERLIRFSDSCGAEIPRWVRLRLSDYREQERADLMKFGCDVVTRLCERLIAEGTPGFHFYAMNQSNPTLCICQRLGFCINNTEEEPSEKDFSHICS